MKLLFAAALFAGAGLLGAPQAQAATSLGHPVLGQPSIEHVAEGCGPGGVRDRFGRCRPAYRPVYRGCPPGTHPTPYGCRRNF